MNNLIPGILILHVFGMILWLGSSLTQYVFLCDPLLSGSLDIRRWSMDLNRRLNKTAVNMGMIIAITTGVILILLNGMDWFRPRIYVHWKILFGVTAAGLAHMGMAKLRRAGDLLLQESGYDSLAYQMLVTSWRRFLMASLVILGINVILAIFKFSK